MKKIINGLKELVNYLTRDELDEKRKNINLSVASALALMIISLVLDLSIGSLAGVFMLAGSLPVSILILWDINIHPESERPFYITYFYKSFILFPLMYCAYGGIDSGMIVWFVLDCVVTSLLFEGVKSVIFTAFDFVVLVVMALLESRFDIVVHFDTEQVASIDKILAVFFVSIVFSIFIKYQQRIHTKKNELLTKQNEMLKTKDKSLEESNENLESALLAKSDFLASMSHEIRTPINAVLGLDEMILRESDDETILKYAADIDSAGRQLLAIINDILDFTKIDSGKMEIHPVEYELYSIANDCYNMINMRAKKKDLEFIIVNNPDIPSYLVGDEIRVRQIIMNILTNAVKYTRDGYVKLAFDKEDIDGENIMLVVSVKDTGIGISEDNIDKLFQSFERIEETRNRHIEGTGLGLSITKKFLGLMNGTIEVESKVDEGSTFTIKIPQKIASKVPMGDFGERFNKQTSIAAVKRGIFTAPTARIMVVDDVKMNLNVVRLLLKNTKMQIDLASSGEESVAMSMMKKYDVILMDHMMPEMDGIEALRKIREIKQGLNKTTPTIALTANALAGAEEMYLKEGFQDYMAKPIKGDDLEAILAKYIPNEKIQYILEEES